MTSCDVDLMDLTVLRARELRAVHGTHRPDDCWVHLQAAVRLVQAGGANNDRWPWR
ncbi:hypothetical protein OHB12_04915 [Nocardia sp. NBC_01730]|uniref:hypothetical protein n=1 Tax=Nocardia sp. NBC_01730 TaxID=2975998 RepID=UPI002E11B6F8|nr:hypothetical protein OHB12_04915 [Nocardia sp. NBC_01730]